MSYVDLWVNITFEIIECIQEGKYNKAQDLFDKRQEIIDKQINLKEFKNKLIENDALSLDKKIKEILTKDMENTKSDIQNYKKTKSMNSSYMKNFSENINIFSQKV